MAKQPASYAGGLKRLRAGRGVSQRELAGALGVSQPLIARTEAGVRGPEGPEEIASVARALALSREEYDELLLLAGYWPSAFLVLGPDDPTLRSVASALTSEALPSPVRDELRRAIDAVMSAVVAALGAGAAVPAEPAPDAGADPSASRRAGKRPAAGTAGPGGPAR